MLLECEKGEVRRCFIKLECLRQGSPAQGELARKAGLRGRLLILETIYQHYGCSLCMKTIPQSAFG